MAYGKSGESGALFDLRLYEDGGVADDSLDVILFIKNGGRREGKEDTSKSSFFSPPMCSTEVSFELREIRKCLPRPNRKSP